jgi:NAD(P)-dependent dehydrogenase (short-subunit alcohol dehydrogenase family)
MLSLAGKRCLITGGSRGIGLAIAQLFASEGAVCTLVGRHEESLETALKSLKPADLYRPHNSYAFDVAMINGWQILIRDLKRVSSTWP